MDSAELLKCANTIGASLPASLTGRRGRVFGQKHVARMKYAVTAIALLLAACHRENASGLTQEQAEAKLLAQGYTYPTIGPSPEGYIAYAMRHGAKIKVTIGKHGVVTSEPY